MNIHRIPVQPRFSDFDMLRHLNNARYATFIELGRVAFFHDIVDPEHDWSETGMIIARLEIDFKAPVFWGEQLFVETDVQSVGSKSIRIMNRVLAGKSEDALTVRAEALTVLVCYHYLNHCSIEVPQKWKQRFDEWAADKIK